MGLKAILEGTKVAGKLIKCYVNKQPMFIGLDITDKCNCHCTGCFWERRKVNKEKTVEEISDFVKKKVEEGIYTVIYLGGEPSLRKDVLEACTKIAPSNIITTNGIINLPDYPNTQIVVSVDGTEKIHDAHRHREGTYRKIKENYSHRPILTTTTLTKENLNAQRKLVEEWKDSSIKGMAFDFATPFTGEDCSSWWLNWVQRHKVIDDLHELKDDYPNLIYMSHRQIDGFRKENTEKRAPTCNVKWLSHSYSSDFKKINPCVIGETADCCRCGCHMPMVFDIFSLDWQSKKAVYEVAVKKQ